MAYTFVNGKYYKDGVPISQTQYYDAENDPAENPSGVPFNHTAPTYNVNMLNQLAATQATNNQSVPVIQPSTLSNLVTSQSVPTATAQPVPVVWNDPVVNPSGVPANIPTPAYNPNDLARIASSNQANALVGTQAVPSTLSNLITSQSVPVATAQSVPVEENDPAENPSGVPAGTPAPLYDPATLERLRLSNAAQAQVGTQAPAPSALSTLITSQNVSVTPYTPTTTAAPGAGTSTPPPTAPATRNVSVTPFTPTTTAAPGAGTSTPPPTAPATQQTTDPNAYWKDYWSKYYAQQYPAFQDPYADQWKNMLSVLGGLAVDSQGSMEQYLPATSTSELSQALQNRALEVLNRPYGYTTDEQNLIYQNALNQFNAGMEQDLGNLQALYEQYGWNRGGGELGGQARQSLNKYFSNRSLAQGDLTAQLAQQMIQQRTTDEQNAIANALGINTQLYDQTRGDFADALSLAQFNQGAEQQQFDNMMSMMQYKSDEEQRNFLNQQGINDRDTQNYWMALATEWGMQQDTARSGDAGLQTLLDYVNQNSVSPDIYAGLLGQAQGSAYDSINTALNSYLQEPSSYSALLNMLGQALGGGTNVNVSNSTTPTTSNNVEAPDLSGITDMFGKLTEYLQNSGSNVNDAFSKIFDWMKTQAGNVENPLEILGEGGKLVWNSAKKAYDWVADATQDADTLAGATAGYEAAQVGNYSAPGTAIATTVGANAGATGGGLLLAGQQLTNWYDSTVGADKVDSQLRKVMGKIDDYAAGAGGRDWVYKIPPTELQNVAKDIMKKWTSGGGGTTLDEVWNKYGQQYLLDVWNAQNGYSDTTKKADAPATSSTSTTVAPTQNMLDSAYNTFEQLAALIAKMKASGVI